MLLHGEALMVGLSTYLKWRKVKGQNLINIQCYIFSLVYIFENTNAAKNDYDNFDKVML